MSGDGGNRERGHMSPDAGVEAGAAEGRDVGDDRLADDVVGEAVQADSDRVGRDQSCGLHLLEQVEHRFLPVPDALGHVGVELASDDGREAQELVGGRREAGAAATDDVAHAFGNSEGPRRRRGERAVLGPEQPHDFLHQERVALGSPVDLVGQRPRWCAGLQLDHPGDCGGRQTG